MVREVPLSKGLVALVDDEDYAAVVATRWYARPAGKTFYAYGHPRGEGRKKCTLLHRFIMNPPPGLQVDHINRDGLNCSRANMRLATPSQNLMNAGSRPSKTGFRGLTFKRNRWFARVKVMGREFTKGTFTDPAEAARAHDVLARKHHGEFAVLNFPLEEAA